MIFGRMGRNITTECDPPNRQSWLSSDGAWGPFHQARVTPIILVILIDFFNRSLTEAKLMASWGALSALAPWAFIATGDVAASSPGCNRKGPALVEGAGLSCQAAASAFFASCSSLRLSKMPCIASQQSAHSRSRPFA
jgi:hypothetical protein